MPTLVPFTDGLRNWLNDSSAHHSYEHRKCPNDGDPYCSFLIEILADELPESGTLNFPSLDKLEQKN